MIRYELSMTASAIMCSLVKFEDIPVHPGGGLGKPQEVDIAVLIIT